LTDLHKHAANRGKQLFASTDPNNGLIDVAQGGIKAGESFKLLLVVLATADVMIDTKFETLAVIFE
jgi:hypothetical protein